MPVKPKACAAAMAMISRPAMAGDPGQARGDPAADVTRVTTPDDLPARQVRQIVCARKHVVCEKPLALNSAHGTDMLTSAGPAGVMRAVRLSVRFYPVIHLCVTLSPARAAAILRTFADTWSRTRAGSRWRTCRPATAPMLKSHPPRRE